MAYVYNSQLDAFSIYHKLQETPEPTTPILGGPALPALGHALAGSTGAAISNICTYPLDLIITRLQIQRQLRKNSTSPHEGEYKDISDAAGKIYTQEGGLSGFYTGVVEDTGKTIADSFLFFFAYNFLRQNRLRSHGSHSRNLPIVDELSVGILAGAFAKLLTTPVANIVTRKQTSALVSSRSKPGVASSSRQTSVRDIASQIHSEKGLQGFWSGYSASLVLTLNPSLTFFFYETFKRSLLPRTERDNPSTLATFLLAAMSKAIASTITYPFSLAKARAQASSRTVDDNDQEVKEGLEKVTAGEFDGTNRTRKAARSTVFSTILHIARTEGVGALYEGLGGEVMKGFFSHGITMIVKEAVHKFTIQLYYMVLKMLKRYPSPQELAQQAKERAQTMVGDVSDQASQATTTVSNGTQNLMQKGQDMAQNGSARAQSLYQEGKEQVSNLGSATQTKANAAAQNTSNAASSAYEASKDTASGAYSNSKDTASSAYDTTKNTATAASDKTKNMAGSAYDTTKDTATGAYDKTKDTANTAYDTTKGTANSAYETSKDTATGAYDNAKDTTNTISSTTKNAGSNTMASANETTERIADYVGKKTENLGRAIRPDSKKSKGEGGEEGS